MWRRIFSCFWPWGRFSKDAKRSSAGGDSEAQEGEKKKRGRSQRKKEKKAAAKQWHKDPNTVTILPKKEARTLTAIEGLEKKAKTWKEKRINKGNKEDFGFTKDSTWEWANRDFDKKTTYLYTDASRVETKKDEPKLTGIGNFFGGLHPLNLSLAIGSTNSVFAGETLAINVALHRLYFWGGFKGQRVVVRTDCLNLMDELWNRQNPEKEARKLYRYDLQEKDPKNLQNLLRLLSCFPEVTLQWVQSHVRGSPDCGNDNADALARDAIKLDVETPKEAKERSKKPKKQDKTSKEEKKITPWDPSIHQITFGNDEKSPFKPQEIQYDKNSSIAKLLKDKNPNLLMDIVREINKDWDM